MKEQEEGSGRDARAAARWISIEAARVAVGATLLGFYTLPPRDSTSPGKKETRAGMAGPGLGGAETPYFTRSIRFVSARPPERRV